jgi:hypothetical protein
MTEERRLSADLRAKAGDGDFLRSVAAAVLQMLIAEGGPLPEAAEAARRTWRA